jgi:hypothetical protein
MAFSTAKSLANVRSVFRKAQWNFTEQKDGDTHYFDVQADGEIESVQGVYQPGCLTLYLVFGVHPAQKRRAELLDFANRMNQFAHSGCVVVRDDGAKGKKLTVLYRTSVDHRKIEDLDERYVASLIADLMDMVQTIDVPLVLIAKGTKAKTAILRTLDAAPVAIRREIKTRRSR